MKEREKILKAFANRRRLAILAYLKKDEANVSDIASVISLSVRSTSKHLGVLFNAGVIEKEQRGPEMFYRIAEDLHEITRSILKLI
jgi:ArsR family transcriptional regulator, arsenate/arsenite/antimonite-responsive transcriptional repressor